MTLLPVVWCELRRAGRRRSLYWIRGGVAGLGAVLAFAIYLCSARGWLDPTAAGRNLFHIVTQLAMAYCLLAGLFTTADCLSEEKRQGTLGLLFLTSLRPYEVVLGKLFGRSLTPIFGLMAVLPSLAMAFLLGGVTPEEFWRVTLVLANTVLLSLTAGIFVSAICFGRREAILLAFLILLGSAPGPVTAYRWALDYQYHTSTRTYWRVLGLVELELGMFLSFACLLNSSTWWDKVRSVGRPGLDRLASLSLTCSRPFRERFLEPESAFWLGKRDLRDIVHLWGAMALAAGACCLGYWQMNRFWGKTPSLCLFTLFLHTFLKSLVALESSRRVSEDRASGNLEIMLTTPIGPPKVIEGYLVFVKRLFFGPALMVLAIDLFLFCLTLGDLQVWSVGFLISLVLLPADAYALGWAGLYFGVVARNSTLAWAWSLISVLVLPWLATICILALVAGASQGRGWGVDLPFCLIAAWTGFSFMTDLGICAWAMTRLIGSLSEIVLRD